ncbi:MULTISPECIES: GNAT family N-acetyltransferase [Cyanophyceae]|uniref:GNAT family N-acetyltransferase n=1 Tax=Leptolyngbya subtilissima DQ-A4 TaxID=2933933 RepID=A0ABV0K143_9CYAN|nr:GNAT family N-acetyltransferase [Nodosilinea sp. FACHB-141]MBD2111010.1 GNAT family N-acetyltransferase [Nodosilinea sp. FACHB-141]
MVQADPNISPLSASAAPQPHVRTVTLRDLDRLTDVLTASFYNRDGWRQWVYPFIRLGIYEDLKQRLKAQSPRYACLAAVAIPTAGSIASNEEAVAGTVEASLRQPWPWQGDRHVYISNLAVDQTFRRQGVALTLLRSCEQVAQRWGIRELQLHVMEDNLAARALYRKAGFSVVQTEDSPASWLGLQARRLMMHKTLQLPTHPTKP